MLVCDTKGVYPYGSLQCVSILVLVDVGLRPLVVMSYVGNKKVSILVLVDVGLRHLEELAEFNETI